MRTFCFFLMLAISHAAAAGYNDQIPVSCNSYEYKCPNGPLRGCQWFTDWDQSNDHRIELVKTGEAGGFARYEGTVPGKFPGGYTYTLHLLENKYQPTGNITYLTLKVDFKGVEFSAQGAFFADARFLDNARKIGFGARCSMILPP